MNTVVDRHEDEHVEGFADGLTDELARLLDYIEESDATFLQKVSMYSQVTGALQELQTDGQGMVDGHIRKLIEDNTELAIEEGFNKTEAVQIGIRTKEWHHRQQQ